MGVYWLACCANRPLPRQSASCLRWSVSPIPRTPGTGNSGSSLPLHHAVCSGSLQAVRVLVDAGAKLTTRDTAWNGTALGWAEYYQREHESGEQSKHYAEIAAYLRDKGAKDD